jgi:hypothetical protein
VRDRQRQHRISEIVKATHWRPHGYAIDFDQPEPIGSDLPPIGLESGAVIEPGDDYAFGFAARRLSDFGLG